MDNKYTNTDLFKITECPSDALLLSYVNNTISKEDIRLVELHLIDCEMCNDMVEGYQRMKPAQISNNIQSLEVKIDKAVAEHQGKKVGSGSFKWYFAAAAILLIGLTGILYNFYFNSLKENEVAVLPMPHQNKETVLIDSVVDKEENISQYKNQLEETVAKEPIKSITIESKNERKPVIVEDLAYSESIHNDDAGVPVEQKKEEPAAVSFDAEMTTKALSDNSATGNATTLQPAFSVTPNTEVITNGATLLFTSPTNNLSNINIAESDTKNQVYSLKKESAAKAKFKNNKPQAQEKNVAEKDQALDEAISEKLDDHKINLLQEANLLFTQKNYNEAILKYTRYLKNEPKNCEALNGLAASYENINRLPEALTNYINLSKQKCNKLSDEAYLKQARLYVKNNQKEEAKKALQVAMQSKYLDIAEQAKKELDKL